jgi:hypothetical protein
MPYYVVGKDSKGKTTIFGPHFSQSKAEEYLTEALSGQGEVVRMQSRDIRAVKQGLKYRMVREQRSIDSGMQNIYHKKDDVEDYGRILGIESDRGLIL